MAVLKINLTDGALNQGAMSRRTITLIQNFIPDFLRIHSKERSFKSVILGTLRVIQ